MMPILRSLCLLMLACTLPAVAESLPPEPPLQYREHLLSNGLKLLVHEDHKAPLVAVQVWYRVGSRDELPGKTGFAHLFEHLMFNGSQHHDDEYFRPLEAAGASVINGTTNADRTNFYETVPTGALDLALWLESDRMGALLPVVTQAKLDEQRGVVKNEKRQREGEPYGRVEELITRASYPPGHPYSWTTIGSMQDLDAAKLGDVQDWFRRYYGPNNAVLVLAGDISFEQAVAKAERYFGAIAPGPAVSRLLSAPVPMPAAKVEQSYDKVAQTRWQRVWNVAPVGSREIALLDLVSDVLAQGKASRLYQRLVTESALATAVSAAIDPAQLGSQFVISVTLRDGVQTEAVAAAVEDELARFQREGPSADELARIKMAGYVARLAGRESVTHIASELAYCEVIRASQAGCEADRELQRMAGADDLREAAKALNAAHYTLTVAPEPGTKAAAPAPVDRARLPAIVEPTGLTLPPLSRFTLRNGIEVLLAERHEVPMVRLSLFWPWGTAAQPEPGNDEMLLGMLSEGAAGRSAEQQAEAYGALGAEFGTGLDADSLGVSLTTTRATLADALSLFADTVRKPDFPAAALARRVQRKLASLQAAAASPNGILALNQMRLAYGAGHAYGRHNSLPKLLAATRALTPDALRALHAATLRPDGARLLVVGDIDAATLKPLLEARFGDWRAAGLPPPRAELAAVPEQGPRVFLFDKPGGEQSLVAVSAIAPPVNDARREALMLANTVLGGAFISRLNLNLREQHHWSYGANSSVSDSLGPSLFSATGAIERDQTAPALREMQRELKELGSTRPPTAAELDQARKSAIRSLPAQVETASGVLGLYQFLLGTGLPLDYYRDYPQRLASIGPEAAATAARAVLKPSALTWIVVGDLARIEASVRALKLGEVKVLDAEGRTLR